MYAKFQSYSEILVAWMIVLLVSDLPEAISQAVLVTSPAWFVWVKAGLLFILILLSLVWKRLYSLYPFFITLLVLIVGLSAIRWFRMTSIYVQGVKQAGWYFQMAASRGIGLLLVVVMVSALLALGKRRQDLFLVKGDLKRWMIPGVTLALFIMILTFLFFDYELPSAATLVQALPLMSAALIFAALFAFNEEVLFRAALLSTLHDVVGKQHAITITAFLFGMAHYFGGAPSGVVGVIIAGALGWLYATMMLETRGIFIPWFNHFLTNIPTLIFWAIASSSG